MANKHLQFTSPRILQSIVLLTFSLITASCHPNHREDDSIRVLINVPPISLHPRRTLDAIGQRLGALIFEGLTRIGPNLEVESGQARSWNPQKDGLSWTFTLREGLKDHLGRPISARDWLACLESYRTGNPPSLLASAFPNWTGTRALGNQVILQFNRPDPYVPTDLSLLRFFRNQAGENCPAQNSEEGIVGSGAFHTNPLLIRDLSPQTEFLAIPNEPGRSALRFLFVKDDNTRALLLARGSADASINSFSTGKWEWIRHSLQKDYRVLSKPGVNVSYLAFNVRRPYVGQASVRRAIGLALERKEIVENWMHGIGSVAYSLVSPLLAESAEKELRAQSEAFSLSKNHGPTELLDRAGYPIGPDGTRFQLTYLTTTVREGYEMGLLIRDQLARVGIVVKLKIVEPSVFFQILKGGAEFDLYSSRWVGVQSASVIHTAYYSKSPRNRTGFKDPDIDLAIMDAMEEMDNSKRKEKFRQIQLKLDEKAVYLPLWYWNNDVVISNRLTGLEASQTSSSGAYDPLSLLKWRSP